MENTSRNTDILNPPKKLPDMLNVLTILTFIGCAFAYIFAAWGFYSSLDLEKNKEAMEEMEEKISDSELGATLMEGSTQMAENSYIYRYELLISSLIFITMCLIGAIMMRRLKKPGFFIYTIGEIGPLIVSALLVGINLIGGVSLAVSGFFALVFIILYATQLKHMK